MEKRLPRKVDTGQWGFNLEWAEQEVEIVVCVFLCETKIGQLSASWRTSILLRSGGVWSELWREEEGHGTEVERREATSIPGVIIVPLVAPPSLLSSESLRLDLVTPHTYYRSSSLPISSWWLAITFLKWKRTCDFFGKKIKEEDLVLYLSSCEVWGNWHVRVIILWSVSEIISTSWSCLEI